jgi:hypothetical protein
MWALCGALALAACAEEGDSGAKGALALTVSGEERATEGFPMRSERRTPFVDGWSVRFTKLLISVSEITVAATGGPTRADATTYVADLTQGDAPLVTLTDIEARRWDRVSFVIAPPGADAVALAGVSAEDVAAMRDAGANYWIEGRATKGDLTYTFAWLVRNPTRNADCTNGQDQTAGVVVPVGVTAQAEVTLHLDHLFWASLGAERATLRFEAIAAAAGDDRHITWDELASQRLSDLKGIDGQPLRDEAGRLLAYNPGPVPLADLNLQAFINASLATAAHFNSSGLCTVQRLP